MKTLEFDAGPDQILEEVEQDGETLVRVRRKVAFLTDPSGNAISTVTKPASGETFTAVKGETPAEDALKGAVPKHAPPKEDQATAWDAAAAKGRLQEWASSDGSGDKDKIGWDKYATGFGWFDSADKENLGAYKLPHHDVVDGELKTNFRGVAAAMAALNGGRGGVVLTDREAVYAHLVDHYEQFDAEPPALKAEDDMDDAEKADALAEAEKGLGERLVAAVKQAFGMVPELDPEETDAQKATISPVTIDEGIARDKFWDLKWAFSDALCTIMWDDDLEADRATLLAALCDDFKARALAILPVVTAQKSEDDGEAIKEHAAASYALSEKAGKVISAANMMKLKAATEALQAVLDKASPPPPPAETEESEDEAEKADVPPQFQTDGEGDEDEDEDETSKATPPPEGETEPEPPAAKKEIDMDAETLKALHEKVEAAKAADDMDAMKAALDEIGVALKGEEPGVEEVAQKAVAGAVKDAVAEALKEAGLEAIATRGTNTLTVLKALVGMPVDGDEDPLGDEVVRLLNAARTEDAIANAGPGTLDSGPAAQSLGGGPAVPTSGTQRGGRTSVKGEGDGEELPAEVDSIAALKEHFDGQVMTLREKLAETRGELNAVKGARPAGSAPLNGPQTEPAAGGWSVGSGLFD